MGTPEAEARKQIDRLLEAAGWLIQDRKDANIHAGPGVALREFPLKSGPVDYALYVDGAVAGAIEAKKEGWTLSGVEAQTKRYSEGLSDALPAYRRPLPFLYESTGQETHFTNLLDPEPRARRVFAFHKPETVREWLAEAGLESVRSMPGEEANPIPDATLRGRLQQMPTLIEEGLWPAQIQAIKNLEKSLAAGKPRALIQMATGSGKTFTAANFVYRLCKFGKAKRVLFLVDRGNLGRQTKKEFDQFVTPDDGRKFTELYVLQHLRSNKLDPTAKVVVSTIQRLYSMLSGAEVPEEADELSSFEAMPALEVPVEYNPAIPIETFDVIVTDECHRSIYNLWRQVLEYFDGFLIGLTATPSKQTFGFFKKNLVMEYDHDHAVADRVNVDFDVYRIRTEVSEKGSKVEAGLFVDKRDKATRKVRWEKLDEELAYGAEQLDRDVVSEDQIRTVIRAFRDRLFTDIFPGRDTVPKTLIFAKNDSHAEDIVEIIRDEFDKGNDFCQKITSKSTGSKPEQLLQDFRNSYNPRIAVTVDMIATGTDVKPLEIVFFMRTVKSRIYFEQMKGRGVRVISPTDLKSVTPDAGEKTRFVIVDAVGVTETDLVDTTPLEKNPTVPFSKILEQVAFGDRSRDVMSTLASRLSRLNHQLTDEEHASLTEAAGGVTVQEMAASVVRALDPDEQVAEARRATGDSTPSEEAIAKAAASLLEEAAKPLANPVLRKLLVDIKRSHEQTIDTTSIDELIEAGYSEEAKETAKTVVESFEVFIKENVDEITALQILLGRPYKKRLTYEQVKELADTIKLPPRSWTPDLLWEAYQRLHENKVTASKSRVLADLVSLVRFATRKEDQLVPFQEKVEERFAAWLKQQENQGASFTEQQQMWLTMIKDQIGSSLEMDVDDFGYTPFNQHGGLGRAAQLFGDRLPELLDELNEALAE
ncbi:MAG: type I restriction-modification enzyme R subunit C-terminal domain-containing protein [Actinomycetota bacterium]